MRVLRATAASLLVLALLSLPVASQADPLPTSTGPAAGTSVRQARLHSRVVIHPMRHHKRFGSHFSINGQVRYTDNGTTYAAAGVRVTLWRRANGATGWSRLARDRTSHASRPTYAFAVDARGNADYRIRFGGNTRLRPSARTTRMIVHREVRSRVAHVSDTDLRLVGHVHPAYRHQPVVLRKRDCRSCSWRRIRFQQTSGRSHFSFAIRAPRSGSWYFRVRVPGSTRFGASRSATFRTFSP